MLFLISTRGAFPLEAVQKGRYQGSREGVPKNSDSWWHGEGVYSNGNIDTAYFLHVHISFIWNYLLHVPSPTCILTKAAEVTSGAWQRVMQSCGDKKKSIYDGENKTKEGKSSLVNTTQHNLFFSFMINDANIEHTKHAHIWAFSRVKWRLSHSILTFDIITFLNNPNMAYSVIEFSKIVCHHLPGDMGEGVKRISDKWLNGGRGDWKKQFLRRRPFGRSPILFHFFFFCDC